MLDRLYVAADLSIVNQGSKQLPLLASCTLGEAPAAPEATASSMDRQVAKLHKTCKRQPRVSCRSSLNCWSRVLFSCARGGLGHAGHATCLPFRLSVNQHHCIKLKDSKKARDHRNMYSMPSRSLFQDQAPQSTWRARHYHMELHGPYRCFDAHPRRYERYQCTKGCICNPAVK